MNKSIFEKLELYPFPHELIKAHKSFTPNKKINLMVDQTLDGATKNLMNALCENCQAKIVSQKPELKVGYLNVFIGTKDSGEFVDEYTQKQQITLSEVGYNPYTLVMDEEKIILLGEDTDAVFLGLQTLRQILFQCKDTLPEVTIRDYSDTKIRGFIEGYYGIPWSDENRMDLMRFGGQYKMNSYIFAPKDDPYHRDQWDELYPTEKLAEIKKLAEVGNETKCRFVWTISPLQKVAQLAKEKEDVMSLLDKNANRMLEKFQQLYDVGVRQFGVLGDDVGALPYDYVVELMKKAQQWVDEKGDVYNLVYCPSSYNSDWAWDPAELNAYEKGFPKDIQIFWTGSKTCGPIVQETIDTFKNKDNDGVVRRDPLFWLNWPVNDIDMTQVFLGKGEMLQLGIKNLVGAVTNPMQEAQASKIALFALADYTWNTKDFDPAKSWHHSFKYIEPDAPESLEILASHMTNTGIDGIMDLEESPTLVKLLPQVLAGVEKGEVLGKLGIGLEDELVDIIQNSEIFMSKSQNEELKKELEPFIASLKELALANHLLLQAVEAKENKHFERQRELYEKALVLYELSGKHQRPTLPSKGEIFAKPAQRYLQPFTEKMIGLLK